MPLSFPSYVIDVYLLHKLKHVSNVFITTTSNWIKGSKSVLEECRAYYKTNSYSSRRY